jgi:putative membrane-bound dehydrogenase-like protein
MSRRPRTRPALPLLALLPSALAVTYAATQGPSAGSLPTVPSGFEIARVAGPPLVDRPIVADFDDEGRLYVADSSGSNDKVEQQLAERPHRIVRLEDRDGDGVFDASTVFADRMMLPQGTLWFDGSLYVAAPPSIWKLTDTDGDGTADRREEWFQGKTLTSCANDLHGPYLGPDGWIYWTKGAFAEQTYERPGKPPLVTRAAHVFRRHPAGTLVEPVLTGGMDNPVDVAFTAAGERIVTATFLEHPQLGRRDAVLHAIYGGVYGKPHAVVDDHPQTGDLMPTLCNLGPAAPAGLEHYASAVFGPGFAGNFFVAQFNMNKVTRHVLRPHGATYTTRDSDFVSSEDRDFHPTDVLEDADGSLLVVDTGAWYKLCCPTSQMAKPDVLGAIYRVRRKGARIVRDPRGGGIAWQSLTAPQTAARLDDPRPAVQRRAIHALSRAGRAALAALQQVVTSPSRPTARLNAVWALTRIDDPGARALVRTAIDDRDSTVRHAALHASALWRDRQAVPNARAALRSPSAAIQRVAAEALGRMGDPAAAGDLLDLAGRPLDRTLEHSVTYALIEIGDPVSVRPGLSAASARARRAALVALDQMGGGALRADDVVPLLDAPDRALRESAWWVAGHHPEWGDALAEFFGRELAQTAAAARGKTADDLPERLARFAAAPAVQALLADSVRGGHSGARLAALRAMALTHAEQLPAVWTQPLVEALGDRDGAVARQAVAVLRAVPPAKEAPAELRHSLLGVARNTSAPTDVRIDALAATGGGADGMPSDLFDFVRTSLAPSQPAAVRIAAAGIAGKARLDRQQLIALADTLKASGPLELPRLLPAFDAGGDDQVGLALVEALGEANARGSVRPDVLRERLARYSPLVQQRGEQLLATLAADSAKQTRQLDQLLALARGGDPRRGQLLFNSAAAACSTCHAIGYHGGKVGPDLTSIGQIRTERDLLEAIVFPNASFPRGYEPVSVTTTTGDVQGGVLRNDLPDVLVLTNAAGEEIRIPKTSIADVQPGTVSLMPGGYGQQFTPHQLGDLVAFLKNTRWGVN